MPFLLYESEAVSSSVKSISDLAPPANCQSAHIQAETDVIRFTFDGSTPSATNGQRLLTGQVPLVIPIEVFRSIKMIRENTDAVLHVHYFAGRDA